MRDMRWTIPLTLALVLGAWGTAADRADRPASDRQEPTCAPMTDAMALEGRTSPYDSATVAVGAGTAKVCYGRPALRDRTMIGGDAVPYDRIWRTGANEPTTIHVNVPATIGGVEVEPGSYSLYTIPRADGPWTLVVNASTSQWGHESRYTDAIEAQDVGRGEVQVERLDEAVEQLTIRPMPGGGGLLLEWQNSRVRIPISPA